MPDHAAAPDPDGEPQIDDLPEAGIDLTGDATFPEEDESGPPHPVNWHLLRADELEAEWYALNRWLETLRRTYGLPASVIPPFWHRHDELVWELSALHTHWLCAYHPEQDGSAPFGWHRDFADARGRLRDWVAASGTRRDRDRPTRQTPWPGDEHTQEEIGRASCRERGESWGGAGGCKEQQREK